MRTSGSGRSFRRRARCEFAATREQHGEQSLRELRAGRHILADVPIADLRLGARQSLADGRRRSQERRHDLGRLQPERDLQHQQRAHARIDRRVRAHEQQLEPSPPRPYLSALSIALNSICLSASMSSCTSGSPSARASEMGAPAVARPTLRADEMNELVSLRAQLWRLLANQPPQPQTAIAPAVRTPKRHSESMHPRVQARTRSKPLDHDPLGPIDPIDGDPLGGL